MARQRCEFIRRSCTIVVVLGVFLIAFLTLHFKKFSLASKETSIRKLLKMDSVSSLPLNTISKLRTPTIDVESHNCQMYNCFNVYKCDGQTKNSNKISVYLYPLTQYTDGHGLVLSPPVSKEFYQLYSAIADSEYYTDDPHNACILIPPIDLLNINSLSTKDIDNILSSLPHWKEGSNHLLFKMVSGDSPELNNALDTPYGKSIIGGGEFSQWSYRSEFDVSIPVFNPEVNALNLDHSLSSFRSIFLISAQMDIHLSTRSILDSLCSKHPDVLVLKKCRNVPEDVSLQLRRCNDQQTQHYSYPQILQTATFCLILRSVHAAQTALSDALKAGCIPVFANDGYILPFSEVLDWNKASVTIRDQDIEKIVDILNEIAPTDVKLKQDSVKWIWENYFSSMSAIALTTLQIINDRIFIHKARSYEEWNGLSKNVKGNFPLNMHNMAPREDGFTAVVLAFDRVESLYKVISGIDEVESLRKIIVIWNNQDKKHPPKDQWPVISKPIEIIPTSVNALSNRFFPYKEIETEAILAIDDDIVMLTADEIEFGYQVWREFPDRLVGFPPRLHLWDEGQNLKYDSEWKNEISIVLTGAAFYHEYYNHLYWFRMAEGVQEFVDSHMNCEDIAMNFLISNFTGKAPIKVTPRKKFRCPECLTGGSLSLEQSHMVERSTCINEFMKMYADLPLKSVNFRADPVLFKDDFPDRLKAFPDMGSL